MMRFIKDKFPLWFKTDTQNNHEYVYEIDENLNLKLNHDNEKLKLSIQKICKSLGEINGR